MVGLWFALMSPAAIARAEKIKASGRWIPAFFDLSHSNRKFTP
jgi:phosphoserine aminotransferase